MNCPDAERLLELRAAELLTPVEDAALMEHLAGCPACREQVDALASLLDQARLPALTATEETRMDELRRLRPVRPVARPPFLRWAATGAAIAASALLGLQLGNVKPSGRRANPAVVTPRASAPTAVNSARIQGVDWVDDGAELDGVTADPDSDSALYDAVVFQGGVMPFDADNG